MRWQNEPFVWSGEFIRNGYRTWYRVTPPPAGIPQRDTIILLHGGPGAGHDYLLDYSCLNLAGHTVIHYDQVGCGRSTHFPKRGEEFFKVELFIQQLDALIAELGIENYHLLGHSWGGMLAVEHAVRQPAGLRSLIIADAPASISLWQSEAYRLWLELSAPAREALETARLNRDYTSAQAKAAVEEYYRKHVGLFNPEPQGLRESSLESQADGHTYEVMWGENECSVTGSLKDWDVTERLPKINVPTLVLAGVNDQATLATTRPFCELIEDVREVRIPASSHVPHIENPDETFAVVKGFLKEVEKNN